MLSNATITQIAKRLDGLPAQWGAAATYNIRCSTTQENGLFGQDGTTTQTRYRDLGRLIVMTSELPSVEALVAGDRIMLAPDGRVAREYYIRHALENISNSGLDHIVLKIADHAQPEVSHQSGCSDNATVTSDEVDGVTSYVRTGTLQGTGAIPYLISVVVPAFRLAHVAPVGWVHETSYKASDDGMLAQYTLSMRNVATAAGTSLQLIGRERIAVAVSLGVAGQTPTIAVPASVPTTARVVVPFYGVATNLPVVMSVMARHATAGDVILYRCTMAQGQTNSGMVTLFSDGVKWMTVVQATNNLAGEYAMPTTFSGALAKISEWALVLKLDPSGGNAELAGSIAVYRNG